MTSPSLLPLSARRTLIRLSIAHEQIRTGWRRSKYGSSPIERLAIETADLAVYLADRATSRPRRVAANAAARKRRASEIEALADSLGVLVGSRTLAAYRRGEIDESEAQRIGAITRDRHEHTDYDALLASGYDRESAREMIR